MRNAEPERDVSKAESDHVMAIGVGGTWQNWLPVTYVTSDRRWDSHVLRSGHTERGLPQRTAVSVRCGMLHSKQTLLTIIFWKHSS